MRPLVVAGGKSRGPLKSRSALRGSWAPTRLPTRSARGRARDPPLRHGRRLRQQDFRARRDRRWFPAYPTTPKSSRGYPSVRPKNPGHSDCVIATHTSSDLFANAHRCCIVLHGRKTSPLWQFAHCPLVQVDEVYRVNPGWGLFVWRPADVVSIPDGRGTMVGMSTRCLLSV